jgi:hypothetical protein
MRALKPKNLFSSTDRPSVVPLFNLQKTALFVNKMRKKKEQEILRYDFRRESF